MLNIVLLSCGAILLALTLVVVYSNYRSLNNRWLGAFLVGGFLWLLANFLANNATSMTADLAYSRATVVGASVLSLSFLMFCYSFTGHRSQLSRTKYAAILAPIVLLLMLSPTSFNIQGVSSDGSIKIGFAYLILLLVIIVYFAWGITLLVRDYRLAALLHKQQLYYILLGTILTVIPGIVLNGVLPIFGDTQAAFFGPAAVIFFAVFTSLAIVKHRLFDIRLILARSLGYASSVILIAAFYGVVVFSLARYVFHFNSSFAAQLFLAAATAIAALTFARLQKIFDRITSNLFYRDAYDSQVFLDQFNKILVATYEMEPLLRRSAKVIEQNLKPGYVVYGITETPDQPRRIIGTANRPDFTEADIGFVRSITPKMRRRLIVTDELEEHYADLAETLRRNNVAVIARLTSSTTEQGIGYLVLGPKKSGNLYNSQDLRLIEIIANELVIAVQNALRFEEIENFNLTLQGKVEEATKKLRRVNERLKALDETKDDFISMASHQLRTPLTSVKGYISMVLEGDGGQLTATQKDMLGQAFFSSQRMVYLIADLLNVSRLKTGKFVIESARTNLANLVEQELGQLQETAKAKNLTLTYDKPAQFPDLMLDETKTRQVIMNFADNAIYYTPAGGHITVRLTDTPSSVELRIEDDGIGVPKAEQHHLFTKFYRAGNARKARPDGTGLGLFMAKKVVVAQGGAIIFASQEGKGSTFGFSFPKAKLAVSDNSHAAPKTVAAVKAEPANVA